MSIATTYWRPMPPTSATASSGVATWSFVVQARSTASFAITRPTAIAVRRRLTDQM